MADLSSFRKFISTVSWQFPERISALLAEGKPKHLSNETWSLGEDKFTTPGSDERYVAGAYALYRRKCRAKGVPVGEFEDVD